MVTPQTHYNPGAQSGPCCTMVGRSSAPWRLVCARGRAQVSSECDSWTKKYVIADMHALDDHDLVLDSDAVADRCAVLHEGSIADVAVTADAGAGKDMGERPDSRPVPNLLALAQSARMHGDTVQWQGSRHGTTHQLLAVHPPRRHASADYPRNSLAARNCRDGRSLLIVHGRGMQRKTTGHLCPSRNNSATAWILATVATESTARHVRMPESPVPRSAIEQIPVSVPIRAKHSAQPWSLMASHGQPPSVA